jgi:hypothetical protein
MFHKSSWSLMALLNISWIFSKQWADAQSHPPILFIPWLKYPPISIKISCLLGPAPAPASLCLARPATADQLAQDPLDSKDQPVTKGAAKPRLLLAITKERILIINQMPVWFLILFGRQIGAAADHVYSIKLLIKI